MQTSKQGVSQEYISNKPRPLSEKDSSDEQAVGSGLHNNVIGPSATFHLFIWSIYHRTKKKDISEERDVITCMWTIMQKVTSIKLSNSPCINIKVRQGLGNVFVLGLFLEPRNVNKSLWVRNKNSSVEELFVTNIHINCLTEYTIAIYIINFCLKHKFVLLMSKDIMKIMNCAIIQWYRSVDSQSAILG